jgi:hypothetical protein
MTAATFTPNAKTLLMNPGDKISVTIKDNGVALETDVNDMITGTTGFMVASAANHFQHANAGTASLNTCTLRQLQRLQLPTGIQHRFRD